MSKKVMRDAVIEKIYQRMHADPSIVFISADFGAPSLDKLRADFPDRFVNVGIAEQNLINVATGFGLEGFKVYAYAIAPFLTMRAYEQIRTNLSILSQIRDINVNLIGVGAGLSYDVTGPTHHCLEDSCIMSVLPNFHLCSPSDAVLAERFVDYSLQRNCPKYLRLDGKPQPDIYPADEAPPIDNGFHELIAGSEVVILATGYMTHIALQVAANLVKKNVNAGVIDVFLLKPFGESMLLKQLKRYSHVVTMEEAFLKKGGLDSTISDLLIDHRMNMSLTRVGFIDKYVFEVGDRTHLHRVYGLDADSIVDTIIADATMHPDYQTNQQF